MTDSTEHPKERREAKGTNLAVSVDLTGTAALKLHDAAQRLSASSTEVVEVLINRFADRLTAERSARNVSAPASFDSERPWESRRVRVPAWVDSVEPF